MPTVWVTAIQLHSIAIMDSQSLSPEQLVVLFKRRGYYDRLRRQLLDSFRQGNGGKRFEAEIRNGCTEYLAQQLLDKSNQGPWPEKSTLQRRIIRDFENRMEIFDEIRQSVEKRFQASDRDNDDYGNRIKTELQSIIDDPEVLNEFMGEKHNQQQQQQQQQRNNIPESADSLADSKAAKRARAALEHSLIMDILTAAPQQAAKKLKSTKPIGKSSSTADVTMDEDKSPAVVTLRNNDIDDKHATSIISPIEAVAAVLAASPFKKQQPGRKGNSDAEEDEMASITSDEPAPDNYMMMETDSSTAAKDDRSSNGSSSDSSQNGDDSNQNAKKDEKMVVESNRRPKRAIANRSRRSSAAAMTSDITDVTITANKRKRRPTVTRQPPQAAEVAAELEVPPEETFTQVFLRGQKLAAWVQTDDGEKCLAVIVKSFDSSTGLYTCRDPDAHRGKQDSWLLPMEKLLHFNYSNGKSFNAGDRVYSLYRTRNSGVSSEFYPGKVESMSENSIQVQFDDGDLATVKLNELFLYPQN